MKNLYTLLFVSLVIVAFSSMAQSYTISPSKSVTMYVDGSSYDEKGMDIVVASDSLRVDWEIIENTVPSGWDVQLCDWENCYTSSFLPPSTVSPTRYIKPNRKGFIKLAIYPNGNYGSALFKIRLTQSNIISPVYDTLSFFVTSTPTSVKAINSKEIIQIYPNPTTDFISINGSVSGPIHVYNMLGDRVVSFTADNSSKINKYDISALPTGTYFLRFTSNGKQQVKKIYKAN